MEAATRWVESLHSTCMRAYMSVHPPIHLFISSQHKSQICSPCTVHACVHVGAPTWTFFFFFSKHKFALLPYSWFGAVATILIEFCRFFFSSCPLNVFLFFLFGSRAVGKTGRSMVGSESVFVCTLNYNRAEMRTFVRSFMRCIQTSAYMCKWLYVHAKQMPGTFVCGAHRSKDVWIETSGCLLHIHACIYVHMPGIYVRVLIHLHACRHICETHAMCEFVFVRMHVWMYVYEHIFISTMCARTFVM